MPDANLSEISAPHNKCAALKEWKNVTLNTPTNFTISLLSQDPVLRQDVRLLQQRLPKTGLDRLQGSNIKDPHYPRRWHAQRSWIVFRVQVLLFALLASAQSHIIPQQVIFNHNWCASKRITFINLIKACQWFNGRYYFGWESVGEEIKSLWHEEALKPFKTQRAHCGGHGTRSYLSNKCQVRPTQVCVLTASLTLSATAQRTCWLVPRLLLTPEHSLKALPAHCLSLFQPRSSKNTLLQLGSESSPNKLTREIAECL